MKRIPCPDNKPGCLVLHYERETRVVNRNTELYDVYIGRPSKWGNPFKPTNKTLQARLIAILRYEEYIIDCPELLASLSELKGKRLGCYCKPKPCHGDVLVELVERFVSQEGVQND